MANDDEGGLSAGGGNRSLEELRISQTILGRKLDSISNDLRRASDTLRVVTENLRIRENRAHLVRRAYISPMGARGQRRARRHVQPAPPEFSESDEGGIPNRRCYDEDSSTYEEIEQWILGEPRFAAQPRYLHHLQPPSSFSSPYTHQTSSPHTDLPYIHRIGHHTRETLKTPTHKFDNAHENQFETIKTHSRLSLETHRLSQFHDHKNHQFANPCSTNPTNPTNRKFYDTHKPPNHQFENQIEITDSYSTLLNSMNHCLTMPLHSKNHQQHADFSNSENKLQMKAITNENGGGCNSQLQFSAAASRVCEVNTSKQNNILVCDFTDTISRCSAPNYSVISQMGQTHENLVGTNSNSKPSVPRIKVTKIEGEDEPLSPVKLVVSSDCGELIGVENGGLSDSEVTVWVKDYANEDDGNAVAVTQGAQFQSFVEANENVLEVVNDTNIMITDYAQNKDLVEVQRLFEKASVRDVFTWTAMVSGYIHNGMVDEARRTFDAMLEKNTVSWNAMLVGYVQSKKMDMARELFEAMTCRNVGSWNTMITGYAQSGEITLARNLFDRSSLDTIACDNVCFAEPVDDKIVLSILENFIRPMVDDKIVLSVLIGKIVSTLGFGFENVKTKGVRRRQWQIAWSFPIFRWTIVLVPLWVWDELRRDFSVGVYHSHKPNMGLAPLSFN